MDVHVNKVKEYPRNTLGTDVSAFRSNMKSVLGRSKVASMRERVVHKLDEAKMENTRIASDKHAGIRSLYIPPHIDSKTAYSNVGVNKTTDNLDGFTHIPHRQVI